MQCTNLSQACALAWAISPALLPDAGEIRKPTGTEYHFFRRAPHDEGARWHVGTWHVANSTFERVDELYPIGALGCSLVPIRDTIDQLAIAACGDIEIEQAKLRAKEQSLDEDEEVFVMLLQFLPGNHMVMPWPSRKGDPPRSEHLHFRRLTSYKKGREVGI